jgi:hypothetical protein
VIEFVVVGDDDSSAARVKLRTTSSAEDLEDVKNAKIHERTML